MGDLEKSVKERKKRVICTNCANGQGKVLKKFRCPCCDGLKDIEKFTVKLPVIDDFVPSLLTYFAKKNELKEAYDAAVNVFNIACKANALTICSPETPWNLTTFIKVSNGVCEQEIAVALYIREIKSTGVIAFKFSRYKGDALSFARIWDTAEQCLMTSSEKIFFDSLEAACDKVQESKEAE